MTLEIGKDEIDKFKEDSQSSPLADDISSTYTISHLDYRLVSEIDHIEEHIIVKKRLAALEKKTQNIEKTLTDSGLKITANKYDIINEFIEVLIEVYSESIKDYKIINEFTEENELICWVIIPVKKTYSPNDFAEYNEQRMNIFKQIYDIAEKYDNCSFSIVSDFEYKDFKDELDIELEYIISDFL